MSLRKSLALVLASVAAACGGSYSESPATDTTTSSALVVAPSTDDAKLTVSSADGSCVSVRDLVEAHEAEVKSLCGDKQIPVPSDPSVDGCTFPAVKAVTFRCVGFAPPPPPKDVCIAIPVKDDRGAMPANGVAHFGPGLPPVICPMFGAAPPPPPGAPEGGQGGQAPMPPQNGQGGPAPMPPQNGPSEQGPVPPQGEGDRRGPPVIICCPPPPPSACGAPQGADAR